MGTRGARISKKINPAYNRSAEALYVPEKDDPVRPGANQHRAYKSRVEGPHWGARDTTARWYAPNWVKV